MQIGIIGLALPPIIGGVETHIEELAKHLVKLGHEVHLFGVRNYKGRINPRFEERDGVKIHRVSGAIKIGRFRFWEFAQWKISREIQKVHQKTPFDLIHTHCVFPTGLAGFWFKNRFNVPYVITSHGIEIMLWSKNPIYNKWRLYNTKRIFKKASKIIAVSEELQRLSIKYGAPLERTITLSNVIDISNFHPGINGGKLREELGYDNEDTVILSLRRLVPKNGVQYLVEVGKYIFPQNRHIKFLIIGEGPLKDNMNSQIKDLGIQNQYLFLGSIDNRLVSHYIAASDIAVFPSLAEATSIACLECMAMGKPVITSNVGGLPEIVSDGLNGLLVDFINTDSSFVDHGLPVPVIKNLSQAILELAANKALQKKLAKNGVRIVRERYNWNKYMNDIETIYGECKRSLYKI